MQVPPTAFVVARDLKRLQQIVTVPLRFGFGDLVGGARIVSIPPETATTHGVDAAPLRQSASGSLPTIAGPAGFSEADISDDPILPESGQTALVRIGSGSPLGTEADVGFRAPVIGLAGRDGREVDEIVGLGSGEICDATHSRTS